MKKHFYTFILVFYFSFLSAKPFISGVWIHAYARGFLTPQEAQKTVEFCRENNINSIFIQVRKLGDAYYKSNTEPFAKNIKVPNYDPLEYIIKLAHSQKPYISVHAWLVIDKVATQSIENRLPNNHIIKRHPEWIMRKYDGSYYFEGGTIWIDPGIPAVRKYYEKIIKEILDKYNVDGIHLDYIRYPAKDSGYNPISIKIFEKETGIKTKPIPSDPKFSRWRRKQITLMVSGIYRLIQREKPNVVLSAAVSCNYKFFGNPQNIENFKKTEPYKNFFQDWASWAKEGILDLLTLMNYKKENPQWAKEYRKWCDFAANMPKRCLVVSGQGKFLPGNTAEKILAQVKYAIQVGLDGFVIYNLTYDDVLKGEKTYTLIKNSIIPQFPEYKLPYWKSQNYKSIYGTIPKPFSTIYLENKNKNLILKTCANFKGEYSFFNLPIGLYLVKYANNSFQVQIKKEMPKLYCLNMQDNTFLIPKIAKNEKKTSNSSNIIQNSKSSQDNSQAENSFKVNLKEIIKKTKNKKPPITETAAKQVEKENTQKEKMQKIVSQSTTTNKIANQPQKINHANKKVCEIILKNGNKIRGEVIEETPDFLKISTNNGKMTLKLPKNIIEKIR